MTKSETIQAEYRCCGDSYKGSIKPCRKIKLLSFFNKPSDRVCRACRKAYYRSRNLERVVEYNRGWNASHVEQVRQKAEERALNNGATSDDFVYFITDGRNVKVGKSKNLMHRLRNLQTASGDQLEVIGLAVGGRRLERRLHWRLKAFRLQGEWFTYNKFVHEIIHPYLFESMIAGVGA